MVAQKVWAGILSGIRAQVSSSAYKFWFSGSLVLELRKSGQRDVLVVATRNGYLKEQLETKYMPLILENAKNNGLINCEIIFVVSQKQKETKSPSEPLFSGVAPTYVNAFRKSEAISPNHTFGNFVVGSSNNLAYLAFSQAAGSVGSLYNPLVVYGPTGVGKTHLLQAFGNFVLGNVMDARVLYVSAEKFTNDFIESLRNHTQQSFRAKYRGVDVLLVDDAQFFSGKEGTQDEFFHTFEELTQAGRQVVLATDKHPKEIVKLKDRLASRLLGGMVVNVGKPDLEMRVAILRQKCQEKGVVLSGEILNYIAATAETGARELEGILVHVLALTKLSAGKITVPEIQNAISSVPKTVRAELTASDIISSVSRYFKVGREDLCGPRRKSSLVYPRQVLMYLMRQDLGLPLGKIGQYLGGRDHSTILYGVDKVESLLAVDQKKRDELYRIRLSF